MPISNEELEGDVIDFGRRMNGNRTQPAVPKQTIRTEIIQLTADQSKAFLSTTDPQFGLEILRAGNGNNDGN